MLPSESPHFAALLVLHRKVQAYSFLSTIFLIFGGVIFLDLYEDNVRGQILESLRSLKTIGIFVLPFLPGIVLGMMAARTQSQYIALLRQAYMAAGMVAPDQPAPKTRKQK